jgi:dienelactone hydrolase
MRDVAFGTPIKARDADTLVVTQSRFDQFPNLWATDTTFAGLQQVTNANPQQSEYRWGKSELIEYVNADGKTLRAILTRPDDFDPAKKYPLMVYIYETMTNRLHGYTAPGPGTSINATRYVSNGYVLLEPDIEYQVGYPGESALKCVVPAVQRVLADGYIDPARVGIQGHSWGGYQITYLVTRTNLFRAVQAGASVSNMVSAYGGIRYGTGISRAFQYEQSQSRIGVPPWDRPQLYLENSPIFWADKVRTPYLTIHNDADGAVPWTQAIEFFTALRRLGKEAYLFNYNGEDHGLRSRENMKHWTVHQAEFFDHYLLGAPAPGLDGRARSVFGARHRDLTAAYKPARRSRKPPPHDRVCKKARRSSHRRQQKANGGPIFGSAVRFSSSQSSAESAPGAPRVVRVAAAIGRGLIAGAIPLAIRRSASDAPGARGARLRLALVLVLLGGISGAPRQERWRWSFCP